MVKGKKLENYDSEPVTYCAKCYSLNIVHEDAIDSDCCGDCGCSDLKTSSIEEWEKLYEGRFGHKFVEKNHDIRKNPIFLLSVSKLKQRVFDSPLCMNLCKAMYPTFPGGLSRADSVILLFAKLCQDNRLDELRIEMIKQSRTK